MIMMEPGSSLVGMSDDCMWHKFKGIKKTRKLRNFAIISAGIEIQIRPKLCISEAYQSRVTLAIIQIRKGDKHTKIEYMWGLTCETPTACKGTVNCNATGTSDSEIESRRMGTSMAKQLQFRHFISIYE